LIVPDPARPVDAINIDHLAMDDQLFSTLTAILNLVA